jgi:hypothetical protein
LSDGFPIQNGLKQGDALTPLLFNFPLEYAIRKFKENQAGLKLNGTHQPLVYADVNFLRDNIDIIRIRETLINASKEGFFIASWVGLSPLYCGHFWPIVPAPDDR